MWKAALTRSHPAGRVGPSRRHTGRAGVARRGGRVCGARSLPRGQRRGAPDHSGGRQARPLGDRRLNTDGRPDLATLNADPPSISVLVATGAPGNFGPANQHPNGRDTRWAGGGRLQRGRASRFWPRYSTGLSASRCCSRAGHPATSGQPRSFRWRPAALARRLVETLRGGGLQRRRTASTSPGRTRNASKVSYCWPVTRPAASARPANFPVIPLTRS